MLLDFAGNGHARKILSMIPSHVEKHAAEPDKLLRIHLESDIDVSFTIYYGSLHLARRATPFNTHKMALMCRVASAEKKLQLDRHPLWDRLGAFVDEIRSASCLTNTRD
jgi:hypothetical protein